MTADVRRMHAAFQCPGGTSTDGEGKTTRQRLIERNDWMELHHPEALGLEEEILKALQRTLRSLTGAFTPNGHEEHGRAQVRGDQYLSLAYLCRLAKSARPDAGRALDAVLAILARERGKVLTDLQPAPMEQLHEALAQLNTESAEAVSTVIRDAADGVVSPEDVARGERELDDVVNRAEVARAALRAAGGKR